jgi:hypothetical protein
MSRRKISRGGSKPPPPRRVAETHEPDAPLPGWPRSHATAYRTERAAPPTSIEVSCTEAEIDECILVRIGETAHYLHATTAEALADALSRAIGSNANGARILVAVHGVDHPLQTADAVSLTTELNATIRDWYGHRESELGGEASAILDRLAGRETRPTRHDSAMHDG